MAYSCKGPWTWIKKCGTFGKMSTCGKNVEHLRLKYLYRAIHNLLKSFDYTNDCNTVKHSTIKYIGYHRSSYVYFEERWLTDPLI